MGKKLEIDITGNATGFAGAAQQTVRGINEIKSAAMALPANLSASLMGRAAGFLAADYLVSKARETIRWADDLETLAARLRITSEELQKLQRVARPMGIGDGDIASAMRKLLLSSQEAQASPKGARQSFGALGITPEMLGSKSPFERLLLIAEKMRGVNSSEQQMAAAFDVLGRSADKLIPMLDPGLSGALARVSVTSAETVRTLAANEKIIQDAGHKVTEEWNKLLVGFIESQMRLMHFLDAVKAGGKQAYDMRDDPGVMPWETFWRKLKEKPAPEEARPGAPLFSDVAEQLTKAAASGGGGAGRSPVDELASIGLYRGQSFNSTLAILRAELGVLHQIRQGVVASADELRELNS